MTSCPCCGHQMVQCFRHHQTVLFCRYCWQEMPDLVTLQEYSLLKPRSLEQMIQWYEPRGLAPVGVSPQGAGSEPQEIQQPTNQPVLKQRLLAA